MREWRLDELIEGLIDYRGKTPPKTSQGVPLITAKVIKAGRILPEPREYIAEEFYDAWMRRGLPRTGDILITTEAPLGEVAQIGADARVALAQRVILIRPDPRKVDPQFLFHYLRSSHTRARIERRASGTTVRGIRQPELRAVEIELPERALQGRVGQILDSLDALVEINQRRVDLLEEMARTIYREWFVHFRYPGHENATFVDSALGLIPESWDLCELGRTVELVKQTVDPSGVDPTMPAVGLEHIPRRQLTLDQWGTAEGLGSRKAVFALGDILFGNIRPYFHKVSVAPLSGICSTDALVLRPQKDHWGQTVMTVSSDEFVAHATQTSNGTKMPRANWNVIKKFPVVMPTAEFARHFTDRCQKLLTTAQRLMEQSRQVASLRDMLLPKLVAGEIDVSRLALDALVEESA